MTDRGNGWKRAGGRAAQLGARTRRVLRPRLVAIIVAALAVLAALGLWAQAMVTPVTRAGEPTATVQPLPGPTSSAPSASTTPSTTPSGSSSPTASGSPQAPQTSAKPQKMKSSGKFTTAGVSVGAVSGLGELRHYTVRVETTSGLSADKVAVQIAGVLNDPRSWAGSGSIRLGLVKDPAKADFTITLASPVTAAKSCRTASGTCTEASDVVIDALSWKTTPGTYPDATDWRSYLVNHGLGQLLGEKPATCPKRTRPAPVMMPQEANLDGCTPNPWPYP